MFAHIARQPVFDRGKRIVGYELLYRGGSGDTADIRDGDEATRSVLTDALTVFGISQLTDRLPAYINFTRNLLLNDFAYLADPKEIVVEIMGDVEIDYRLISKVQALRKAGYRVALDGYDGGVRYDRILQSVNVVRVDFSVESRIRQRDLISKLNYGGIQPLAEKIETYDDFIAARDMGFVLFQGYFFEKPVNLAKKVPTLSQSPYGALLTRLLEPAPDYDACAEIIANDAVLTYLFMRQLRTTDYRRGDRLQEIRRGFLMMGTEGLRRWACLVVLRQSNVTHSDESARRAYLRGCFIERLMERADTTIPPREGFLLGLFSLMDRVTGIRLESLLREINLGTELANAILGTAENEYSAFLLYAVIYEMENPKLILPDIRLELDGQQVASLYMECIANTDAAFARLGGHAR